MAANVIIYNILEKFDIYGCRGGAFSGSSGVSRVIRGLFSRS